MHELTKTLVNVPSLNYLIHLEELGSLFSEGGEFFSQLFFFHFCHLFFNFIFQYLLDFEFIIQFIFYKIIIVLNKHLSSCNQVKNNSLT
jgi:hypothetical protein